MEKKFDEMTEEEKKELSEKFLRSALINKNKGTLKAICNTKLSVEELLLQIENKTCKLSRTQRDFLQSFKIEFLEKLITEYKETYVRH